MRFMVNLRELVLPICVGLGGALSIACGDGGGALTMGTLTQHTSLPPSGGEEGPGSEGTTDSSPSPTDGSTAANTVGTGETSSPTGGETMSSTTDIDVTATSTAPSTDATTDPSTGPSTDTSTDPSTASETGDPPPVCGDGVIEGQEACDDGNQTPGDGCEANCTPTPKCGNGVIEGQEACDDGNQTPGDGCEVNCTATPKCGNGVVEGGEVCDDGNVNGGDTCSADCKKVTQPQVCGDGKVQPPEVCDDGDKQNGDGCENDCTPTPPQCGNGVVEPGEKCDDGNAINGGPNDFCKNDCTIYVPPQCSAPANYVVCDANLSLNDKATTVNAHKAMGICNDTDANSVKITNFQLDAPDPVSWQVAKGFGTYKFDDDQDPGTPDGLLYKPREGGAMLMISTGKIAAPNASGVVIEAANSQVNNGANNNPDAPDTLPAPLSPLFGSNGGAGGTPGSACDGVHDCSDSLQAQWNTGSKNPGDKLFFRFNAKVPQGTFGYTFQLVLCSSEWPSWVGTNFNDMLVMWQTDPTPDAFTGNVTYLTTPLKPNEAKPLTITTLDTYFKGSGFSSFEPQLAGTGFESHACTDWLTVRGGVQPGATLNLAFFLADMGDTGLATVALLDNFRWSCEGCDPAQIDECGMSVPG